MATFDNLVSEVAGGPIIDRFVRSSQEGTTWRYSVPVIAVEIDDEGNESDVDMTGVTCVWQILTKSNGGDVVVDLTTSLVNGCWTGVVEEDDTANLAENYSNPARYLPWFCTLTNGDGEKVSVFGPHDSRIIIKQGE